MSPLLSTKLSLFRIISETPEVKFGLSCVRIGGKIRVKLCQVWDKVWVKVANTFVTNS